MSNLATITNNILADSGIDDINVIVSTGSYANPAWITSLAWTKITNRPTTLGGYGITDAYTQTQVDTLLAAKQNTLSLTTTGTSGAATLIGATLNIPQYQTALTNPVTGTGTTNYLPKFTGTSTIGNSIVQEGGAGIFINGVDNFIPTNGGWFFNGSGNYASGIFASSSSNNLNLRSPQKILFQIGFSTEAMTLSSSGNLLVGTTSDNGARLQVSGTATFSGQINGTSGLFSGNIQLFTGSFFRGSNTGGSPINLAGVGFDNNIYFGDDGVATNIRLGNSAGYVRVSSGGRILINTTVDNLANALQVNGSATFSSSVTAQVNNISADGAGVVLQGYIDNTLRIAVRGSGYNSGARGGLLASTGDFSSSVTAQVNNISADGAGVVLQGYIDNTLRIAVRGSGYNSGARGGLLASTGDFSSSVTAANFAVGAASNFNAMFYTVGAVASYIQLANGSTGAGSANGMLLGVDGSGNGIVNVRGAVDYITSVAGLERFRISSSGAATFSSTLTTGGDISVSNAIRYKVSGTEYGVSFANAGAFGIEAYQGTYFFIGTGSGASATERLRIFNDGNLLIQSGGTFTNNGARLQVSGAGFFSNTVSNLNNLIYSGGSLFLRNPANTFDWALYQDSANNLKVDFNGATRLTLTSGGAATFSSSVTAGGSITSSTANYPQLIFQETTTSTNSLIFYDNVGSPKSLRFRVNGATNLMSINENGNVLIGTTTDNGLKFQTNGDGYFSGSVGVGNSSMFTKFNLRHSNTTVYSPTNSATWLSGINLYNDSTPALNISNLISFYGSSNVNSVFGVVQNASGVGDFIFSGYNGSTFGELMRITSGGNVGIGTPSPGTFLQVSGTSAKSLTGFFHTAITDLTTMGTGVGGGITFVGYKTAQTAQEAFAGIDGFKENSTAGNAAGAFRILTQPSSGAGLVEQMRITSGGNVLIGTTTDTGARLQVVGSSLTNTFRVTDAANYTICMGYEGTGNIGLISTLGSTASLALGTNSTARMTITSGGNVLIGTTTDIAGRLQVSAPSALVTVTSTTIETFNGLEFKNGGGSFYIGQDSSTGNFYGSNTAYAGCLYTSGPRPIVFLPGTVERMRITSAGNVGIGTPSPLAFGGLTTLSINGNVGALGLMNNGSNVFLLYNDGSNTLLNSVSNTGLVFGTNNTERMRITSSGNVLIGTTTDTGSRLGIKSSGTNSFPLIVQRSANTNTLAAISETSGGDGSFLLANSLGSTNIQLLSNGTSILNGGNVLIGTTNDPGATLHVNGTIRTGQLPGAIQNAVNWRLGTARGGPVTSNATVRVEIDGVLVDLLARYV